MARHGLGGGRSNSYTPGPSNFTSTRELKVATSDSKFFNIFSLVIGLLVLITILIFALARSVGHELQTSKRVEEEKYVRAVDARVAGARVAIAGQDNSALTIQPAAGAAVTAALALPTDGVSTYETVCGACHAQGIGGAPKAGDKGLWGARIAQGQATLYKHALEGYTGKAGVMPAKGGRVDLTDDLVKAAVDHMVALAK